jgi:PKD repeat protein
MSNFYRPRPSYAIILGLLLFPVLVWAQTFTGIPAKTAVNPQLAKTLSSWETYAIDLQGLDAFIQSNTQSPVFDLVLGAHQWTVHLTPSNITRGGYLSQEWTEDGLVKTYRNKTIAFGGYEQNGGGRVSLTVDEDFLYGYIEENGDKWYIEPLRYNQPDAPGNQIIVYHRSAVNYDHGGTCAVIETEESMQQFQTEEDLHDHHDEAESMACYELEVAIASDKSMFTKYGSVGAVEAHNVAVLNNVQNNYIGSFNHDIEFVIVTQFVVTGNDPWTNSLDAATLLASFRTWGNANGFGVAFDNASLWTNRDFTGGTIGIAYLNGICNTNKYNCLQDFSNNSELLRCLWAHELGHNWSATHDGAGACPPNYIMCPFVTTSNDWSGQSESQISAYITNRINAGNCLSVCGGNQPPTADFDWSPNPGCAGQQIQFTDQSSGNVNTRTWTFQNGNPATSNLANPIVTWNTGGTYNVTLTVNGPGGSSTKTEQVQIIPQPVANFTSSVNGLTVTFNNTSQNATSYNWDFGDGESSAEQNPVHTYFAAGIYQVTLTVENACGTSIRTLFVNTAPTAEFSASPTQGCAALVVQFTNESSNNAVSYLWQFPGGAPSSSSQPNPVVVYSTSGNFTVTLTAINSSGSNTITKTNYIQVQTVPSSNFNYTVNGLTVNFTAQSVGATSYLWNFGDGNTSTLMNPTHTYAVGGNYTVTLTSINNCGNTVATKTVGLTPPPTANFSAGNTSGCATFTTTFINQSSANTDSVSWFFPGGSPGSSSLDTVTVSYANAGAYTVTLIALNAGGADTLTQSNYISVNDTPAGAFTAATNGAEVIFDNTTQNANTYLWNFGDGNTSDQAEPAHTYGSDGVYTVTLIATNACGNDTVTQQVTIVTPPAAGFSAGPLNGCAALSVQFTNQSSNNATSFQWSFPGGDPSSSTAEDPLVIYHTPGVYSATLIAVNSAGNDTLVQNNIITVNTVPAAGFSSNTNGFTANFNNTSNGATGYDWNFGDNNGSNEVNPTHTYAADGAYTVTLIATNACGPDTFTQTVVIVTPPSANFSVSPASGCAPLTVTFANESSENATSFQWEFPGGNPANSTEENPVVVYDAPGVYTVTLIAGNPAGSDTVTRTEIITANDAPAAGFTASVNGATAQFDNTSNGATGFNWDFGDDNGSNEAEPSHTYQADGVYTVVLIATNTCGNDTMIQTVTIATPPQAGFSAPATAGCAPLTVQFENESSDNATGFQWEFPGGTPASSTEENPVVAYDTPGAYDVTLIVSNPQGNDTLTLTNYVNVAGLPTSGFDQTINGASVQFTNTAQSATGYSWDFGDNNGSNEADPSHTYQADGVYTVVLTVSNACGTATFSREVTIITPPLAAFSADQTEGCVPFIVQFINESSENATTFTWEFEGGTPSGSTEENPSVTWKTPGVYQVKLTATNPAGSNTITSTVTVKTVPNAGFSVALAGLSVVLTNNTQNADTYAWKFGDGNTSNETDPTHTYSTPGSYQIILEATNECGASTVSQSVEIQGAAPIAAFSADNVEGCAPLFSVQFTDQSAGNPTAWSWSFQGGTPSSSTEENPVVVYSTPGTYAVELTVTNPYGQGSLQIVDYITVGLPPAAGFSYITSQGTVAFANNSQGADFYLWSFGDGNTSTEAAPTHTYQNSGAYTVELTAVNECGASTLQQIVMVVLVGTDEANLFKALKLFPNPSTGSFTLQLQGEPRQSLEFLLYNALGQLVGRSEADFGAGVLEQKFDYPNLQSGIYSLCVRAGDRQTYIKLVVE